MKERVRIEDGVILKKSEKSEDKRHRSISRSVKARGKVAAHGPESAVVLGFRQESKFAVKLQISLANQPNNKQ